MRIMLLQELGHLIWWTLLQSSPIQPIRKETAIRFLEEFASAYLVGLDLEAALKQVRDTPPPTFGNLFEAPHLISRHRAGGPRNPHLQDDLLERIYAAYHALRRAGIHRARWRVAEALNAHGIGTRARKDTPRTWGSYEVYERVKQYEAGLKKRTVAVERVQTAQQCRASVVDQWTSAFRWNGICESLALRLHSPIA